MNKKYRENMRIRNLDDVILFLRDFVDNITYGEMQEIAKDKKKLDLLEKLYKEFGSVLNDADIISKKERSKK